MVKQMNNDNDADESNASNGVPKDPEQVGMGKFYKSQTPNGKAMVKMFKKLCNFPYLVTNIVVYFGVFIKGFLAEFLCTLWKDMFTQWQNCHPTGNGIEQRISLSPHKQDLVKCAAWVYRHSLS